MKSIISYVREKEILKCKELNAKENLLQHKNIEEENRRKVDKNIRKIEVRKEKNNGTEIRQKCL